MAFRYKGQINYVTDNNHTPVPAFAISGLRKTVRLINYSKNTATLIVLFREAAAAAFFKEPLHELFEDSVPLDSLITRQKLSIIEEQLAAAKNNHERIAVTEQFLLSRLHAPKPDGLISAAVQKIYAAGGTTTIGALAASLYISNDAFEKRFRRAVGTSPKQFSSIVRLKSLIAQGGQHQTLSDMAFEAGYTDQPHFNKAFKLFTGQTPTEFFKSPLFW
jgi:AraC-like DNA-binding protein